ncbi:MAG TPA: cation:proton antiporter [Anaerolineae bacterium]|nr:cation:proton antiporter [Anaerolineae bacterium]
MVYILTFLAFTAAGGIAGWWSGINPIEQSAFPAFAAFALVFGLYGSVVGIDLEAIRKQKWLAVMVITVAVPLQILATGAVMYLIEPVVISFLVAVAITQIDPLSVDTLLQDKEGMSEEAKGLLRVWASFDDPVTVLFGFLILLPLVTGEPVSVEGGGGSYVVGLLQNLVPAVAVWVMAMRTNWLERQEFALILLIGLLGYAFYVEAYLLAAILGLLIRPIPEKYLTRTISILYHAIVFVVGMSLYSYGVDLRFGLILALVEFFIIQPTTTIIIFQGTPKDLLRIAYAQQNGLTTLLMGIAFQGLGFDVLPILLPAIIAVNLINLVINKIYSYREAAGFIG